MHRWSVIRSKLGWVALIWVLTTKILLSSEKWFVWAIEYSSIDLGLEIRLKPVWASRFFWAKSCPLPMCGSALYSIPKRDNNDLQLFSFYLFNLSQLTQLAAFDGIICGEGFIVLERHGPVLQCTVHKGTGFVEMLSRDKKLYKIRYVIVSQQV